MDGAVFVTLNLHHSQFKGVRGEGPVLRWDEGERRLVGLHRTIPGISSKCFDAGRVSYIYFH